MSSKSGFRWLTKVMFLGTIVAAAFALNTAVAAPINYYWSFADNGVGSGPVPLYTQKWSTDETNWNKYFGDANDAILEGATGGGLTLGSYESMDYLRFKTAGYSIDNTAGNGGQAKLEMMGQSTIDVYPSCSGIISVILEGGTTDAVGIPAANKITKSSAGTLYLTGAASNLFTVPLYITGGSVHLGKTGGAIAVAGNIYLTGGSYNANSSDDSLALDGDNQIASTSVITFNPSANYYTALNLNGHSQTVAGIQDTTGRGWIQSNNTSGTATTNATLTVGDSNNYTYNGTIVNYAGSVASLVALVKQGTGTLTLGGTNHFNGGLTVNGGTVQMGINGSGANGGPLGGPANAVLVNNGGAIDYNGFAREDLGSLTINGTGVSGAGALLNSAAGAAGDTTHPVVLGSDSSIGVTQATGSLSVASITSASGSPGVGYNLTKVGSGTLNFGSGGGNQFNNLTVTAGTVVNNAGGDSGLGNGNDFVYSGATLDFNGGGTTQSSKGYYINGAGVGGNGALINSAINTTAGWEVDGTGAGLVITLASDSSIGGAGNITFRNIVGYNGVTTYNLTKVGAGTLRFGIWGSNQFQNLTVAGGTVIVNKVVDSALGSGADLVLSGATIDLYGGAPNAHNTITINGTGVGGNGALLNSSTYAAGNAGLNVVLGSASSIGGSGNITLGTIGGGFDLTKVGAGTLTLSGAIGYTGNTLVTAGTLSLTQMGLSDTSEVSIASGAILNLGFSGTDIIGSLYLNGVAQAPGIYGAGTPGGYITGGGYLDIVPEPGALALLATALIGLLAYAWRKRP